MINSDNERFGEELSKYLRNIAPAEREEIDFFNMKRKHTQLEDLFANGLRIDNKVLTSEEMYNAKIDRNVKSFRNRILKKGPKLLPLIREAITHITLDEMAQALVKEGISENIETAREIVPIYFSNGAIKYNFNCALYFSKKVNDEGKTLYRVWDREHNV
jgi:hypothetical protein